MEKFFVSCCKEGNFKLFLFCLLVIGLTRDAGVNYPKTTLKVIHEAKICYLFGSAIIGRISGVLIDRYITSTDECKDMFAHVTRLYEHIKSKIEPHPNLKKNIWLNNFFWPGKDFNYLNVN